MPLRNAYELFQQERKVYEIYLNNENHIEINKKRTSDKISPQSQHNSPVALIHKKTNKFKKKQQFLTLHILNLAIFFKTWKKFSQNIKKSSEMTFIQSFLDKYEYQDGLQIMNNE